jgi:two-component system response regulator CpxR
MRPKKRILLIDTDEQRLSARCFLLKTHGYVAMGTSTSEEAADVLRGWVDLILAAWPLRNDPLTDLLRQVIAAGTGIPVIVIAKRPEDARVLADAILPGLTTTPAELLERVKVMSRRKRGPRKGTVYSKSPASVAPADDLAIRSAS